MTTSIGIALSAPGQTLPEELLRNADSAMYSAKRHGKNRYELFDPDTYDPMLGLLEVDGRALRGAGPGDRRARHRRRRARQRAAAR